MKTVIYIDVLIFLNTVVTFLLLAASSKLVKTAPSAGRIVVASLVGGVSSLIIFAPEMGFALSLLIKLLFSVIITAAAYNPKSVRALLKQTGYFFAVSFMFAGIILFVSSLPGINLLTYNNGVVYIDLSLFSLIAASVICYSVTVILNKITRHKHENDILCSTKITVNGITVSAPSILDTGNTLTDPFTGESVIISDRFTLNSILPDNVRLYLDGKAESCSEIRLVPCSTVTSESLLPVFRVDSVEISDGNNKFSIDSPLVGVCDKKLENIILPSDVSECKQRSSYNV